MKQKIWIFILLSISLFVNRTTFAAPATATSPPEQGEEVYDPNTTNKPKENKVKTPVKDNVPKKDEKIKNYPETNPNPSSIISPNQTMDTNSQKGLPNTTLKDFTKTENTPNKTNQTDANQIENKNNTQVEEDKDIEIENNKLVDVDDKTVETKKYSGILWFIGVFVALLIVIFSFT